MTFCYKVIQGAHKNIPPQQQQLGPLLDLMAIAAGKKETEKCVRRGTSIKKSKF